jgi:hypothetical protein
MVIERWEFSRAAIICRAGRHMRAFRIYISALKMGLPRLYCKVLSNYGPSCRTFTSGFWRKDIRQFKVEFEYRFSRNGTYGVGVGSDPAQQGIVHSADQNDIAKIMG